MVDIIKELSNPEIFPEKPASVKIIQTHISIICLTGKYAYKFKKHVNFGFLDFSTLKKRKFYCEEELRLNRRLSPEIYLDMVELRHDRKNNSFSINGEGELIDYGIKMKEFRQESILVNLVEKNLLTSKEIDQITDALVGFYDSAKTSDEISDYGSVESFKVNTDENFEQTKAMIGKTISKEQFDLIKEKTNKFYEINDWLFEKRIKDSKIKECHGDLHTGNMFLNEDNDVRIFDCIEFNERFKNSDVAADIAFLSMDLDFHGKEELSKELIMGYVKKSDDWDLLKVLNFYKCYRAYVRGKVLGFLLSDENIPEKEKAGIINRAKKYFDLAEKYAENIDYRYIEFKKPLVIMTSAFSAAGKSYIGKRLTKYMNLKYLSSDSIRKELFEIDKNKKVHVGCGEGMYSYENRTKVYDEMFKKTASFLSQGNSCYLDATFLKTELRKRGFETIKNIDAEFVILNPVVKEENIKKWIKGKSQDKKDMSDANWNTYLKQKEVFENFSDEEKKYLITMDANSDLCYEDAYDKLIKRLKDNIK